MKPKSLFQNDLDNINTRISELNDNESNFNTLLVSQK